jgi:hypothetical protein
MKQVHDRIFITFYHDWLGHALSWGANLSGYLLVCHTVEFVGLRK